MSKQRLSKVLASAGIASRRACEALIFSRTVTVNGTVVDVPQTLVDISSDAITVHGKPVSKVDKKAYYLLNKPVGYICSSSRNGSEKLVLDLFQDEGLRLFTVGRLDKDTGGLLLVTNDGHFGQRVIHPSANIQKEYLVKVDQEVEHEHLLAISNGTLVEGVFVKPIKVEKLRRGTLKIIIAEGKKREVRLLLDAARLTVKSLTRIRLGALTLGALAPGEWRSLTEKEIKLFTGRDESL